MPLRSVVSLSVKVLVVVILSVIILSVIEVCLFLAEDLFFTKILLCNWIFL